MRPPPAQTNVARPEQVAAGERLQELRDRLIRNDLAVALKQTECRRVLWRVLEQSGVFSDIETTDPLALAHRVGQQSVGRFLWAVIDDVNDQAVLQMRTDARARMRQEMAEAEAMRTSYAEQDE
jgi:hypothetical protein